MQLINHNTFLSQNKWAENLIFTAYHPKVVDKKRHVWHYNVFNYCSEAQLFEDWAVEVVYLDDMSSNSRVVVIIE